MWCIIHSLSVCPNLHVSCQNGEFGFIKVLVLRARLMIEVVLQSSNLKIRSFTDVHEITDYLHTGIG